MVETLEYSTAEAAALSFAAHENSTRVPVTKKAWVKSRASARRDTAKDSLPFLLKLGDDLFGSRRTLALVVHVEQVHCEPLFATRLDRVRSHYVD